MHALLPALAAGYVAGLLSAFLLGFQAPLWPLAGVFVSILLPLRSTLVLLASAVLGAALIGAYAWSGAAPEQRACDVARVVSRETVQLLARVVSPAALDQQGGQRQKARVHWLARERDRTRRLHVCGVVMVHRPGAAPPWPVGQLVQLRGRLKPVAPLAADFTARARGLREPVQGRIFVADGMGVAVGIAELGALERVRDRIRSMVARMEAPAQARSIVRALVLGEAVDLTADRRECYSSAGVSHLLAVSGLHLSLVAGFVFAGLALLLRCSARLASRCDTGQWAAAGALLAAIGYTMLTAESPATARSCVMAASGYIARIAARSRDFLRPMALAALLLLALEPASLLRPGFQLSFAAVVGIALISARSSAASPRAGLRAWLLDLSRASFGATVMTAPFVAYHFGTVSLVGVVANLLAVPWTTYLLLPSALIGALAGLVSPPVGLTILAGAGWFATQLDRFAMWLGQLPFSAIGVFAGPAALGGGLIVAFAALWRRRGWRKAASIGLVLLIGDVLAGVVGCGGRDRLRLSFIDVGQGDSALVQLPDGATMLVDAGGSPWADFDPGESRVVPYLRAAGVRRLDYLVVTHPDADHAGGVPAVLRHFAVGELWLCWHDGPNEWVARLRASARARGVPLRVPREVRHEQATIRPLWPRPGSAGCADPARSTNNNSVVLQIALGKQHVLMTGDIEADVERQLARLPALSPAMILKAPHHGSATSSTPALLQRVRPAVAVVSCGRLNRFGFPHPSVVARYQRLGVRLLRTDELGTFSLSLDPSGAVQVLREGP